QAILDCGAADPDAGIPAGEKRIRVECAALQARISRHVVVPEIEIGAAVEIVASRAGDNVDASRRSDSSRGIEIHGLNLELLRPFVVEFLGLPAFVFAVDAAALHLYQWAAAAA